MQLYPWPRFLVPPRLNTDIAKFHVFKNVKNKSWLIWQRERGISDNVNRKRHEKFTRHVVARSVNMLAILVSRELQRRLTKLIIFKLMARKETISMVLPENKIHRGTKLMRSSRLCEVGKAVPRVSAGPTVVMVIWKWNVYIHMAVALFGTSGGDRRT